MFTRKLTIKNNEIAPLFIKPEVLPPLRGGVPPDRGGVPPDRGGVPPDRGGR